MYADPIDLFGRLSMEMMRAVRLVVDTGIHTKGWSVEKAMEYMMEKTGMHRHECEAECFRYEAWPGQACAYFVGYVAIRRMREKAEAILAKAGIEFHCGSTLPDDVLVVAVFFACRYVTVAAAIVTCIVVCAVAIPSFGVLIVIFTQAHITFPHSHTFAHLLFTHSLYCILPSTPIIHTHTSTHSLIHSLNHSHQRESPHPPINVTLYTT